MYKYFFLFILVVAISCKKKNTTYQPDPVPIPQDTTGNNNGGGNINPLSTLTINLSGMQNTNGKINIALYNSSATYNDPNQAYKELFVPCNATSMSFTLDSIPAGEYAFAIFHDENDNQQLDQNFLNIPTEGFAFSNNSMGNFGPPSWSQAKFTITESSAVTQNITLNFF